MRWLEIERRVKERILAASKCWRNAAHTECHTHLAHLTIPRAIFYFHYRSTIRKQKKWVWTPDSGGGRCPSRAFSKCFSYRISIKILQGLGHSVHSAPQSDHRLHKGISLKREIPSLETHIITTSVFFYYCPFICPHFSLRCPKLGTSGNGAIGWGSLGLRWLSALTPCRSFTPGRGFFHKSSNVDNEPTCVGQGFFESWCCSCRWEKLESEEEDAGCCQAHELHFVWRQAAWPLKWQLPKWEHPADYISLLAE